MGMAVDAVQRARVGHRLGRLALVQRRLGIRRLFAGTNHGWSRWATLLGDAHAENRTGHGRGQRGLGIPISVFNTGRLESTVGKYHGI